MRLTGICAVVILLSTSAHAAQPQFWRVGSAEEFLAGEIEGMIIDSRGRLSAGPGVKKVASFTEPFVLSQAVDPSGTRYVGTGNEGKVYQLKGTELKMLYTATEPEIYAMAFANGSLLIGSSPNGKVYRVDPGTGKATEFFDPKQAYIWAIVPLPDGSIAVATGVEGKLFRVASNGQGTLWYDAPEGHLRSLAVASEGRVLAGGSGEGRIYEVTASGKGRALYDSSLTEISAIYYDPKTGLGWAAAAANVLPMSAPPKPDQKPRTDGKKEGEAQAATTAEVSFSFEEQPSGLTPGGTSELYRIDKDGYVEIVRKFDREIVYSLGGGGRAGSVLLATGPHGRIYEYFDHEISLLATVPEKQVVSFGRTQDGSLRVTTTNSGAVYHVGGSEKVKSEYRSAVKDAERFSQFGSYRVEGDGLASANVVASFRSGNTSSPDETWSDWSVSRGVEGKTGTPAARYLQWKLNIDASDARVEAVTVAFVNRNVAPVVEGLFVAEPGAVFISSSFPMSPQVLEATNPDEYGIFTSLDNPKERNDPGKKLFRKGFRTISWKARDDNMDTLRSSVSFRRKGSSEWLRLRENIEETQLNFDTSQLPDDEYEVRLVVSDATDNPQQPLEASKEGVRFVVDNSPPTISFRTESSAIVVIVRDGASPVGKVEYSIDAKKWERLTPSDGLTDSREETFLLPPGQVAGRFVVVRAVDAFSNVATGSVGR